MAQSQAPQEPVKQWVKTKANMTAEAFFAFNSARLTPSAKAELDRVAQQLKTQGHEGNVLIIGHTCDLGSDAANDKLSLQRATAVRDYLVAAGAFGATESLAEGRGKRDPKYPAEPATREKNRRVELEFYSFVDEEQEVVPAPAPASTTTAAASPQPPAVTYERELVDQPPAWVRQALRTPALHKRTVDVYRTKEETQTENRSRTWVNRAPTATDDSYQVAQGSTTTLPILANDTDPDQGDTLTLVSVGQPAQGRVRIEGSQVVYIAPSNYAGADKFTYSIRDQQGLTSTAQVVVQVTGNASNRAPVAVGDTYWVSGTTAVMLSVLANDTDPDGDTLSIVGVTQPDNLSGTVQIMGSQILFTPKAPFYADTFTYTISDGKGGKSTAMVHLLDP